MQTVQILPDKGNSHYCTIPDIDVTLNGVRNLFLNLSLLVSIMYIVPFLKRTAYEII